MIGVFLAPFLFNNFSYGQQTYDIIIPTGASHPSNPYFWQVEKDGSTEGIIEIKLNDSIVWKNADTDSHPLVSGTPESGPDGFFESGPLPPGDKFEFKFTEKGVYPFYCVRHEWMTGIVFVTDQYSLVPDVGIDAGDGKTSFDVEYQFNRLISNPSVNEGKKSITFEIIGKPKSPDHNLHLRLPSSLLEGPYVIWIDGEKTNDFDHVKEGQINILDIQMSESSKEITIIGTSVVPEFGFVSTLILSVSIMGMVIFSKNRFKFR